MLILLASCGGDDGTGMSVDEFRAQVNAICAKYQQRLEALGGTRSPDELQTYVEKALPIAEEWTAEFEKVEPPSQFQDDWNRLMELQHQGVAKTEELQDALRDKDTARIQAAFAGADATANEADRLAARLGLSECAGDG